MRRMAARPAIAAAKEVPTVKADPPLTMTGLGFEVMVMLAGFVVDTGVVLVVLAAWIWPSEIWEMTAPAPAAVALAVVTCGCPSLASETGAAVVVGTCGCPSEIWEMRAVGN